MKKLFLALITTNLFLPAYADSFSLSLDGKHFNCTEGNAASSNTRCKVLKKGQKDSETNYNCNPTFDNYCTIVIKYGQITSSSLHDYAWEAANKCDQVLGN